MPPHYKLIYFPIKANGEIIRQIFAYSGVKFEDFHVNKSQWKAMKREMPFHRLPVLLVDGKPLAQSHSIARFLAREFKINGKNAWEEAQVNSLADQFKDYQTEIHPFFMKRRVSPGDDAVDLFQELFLPSFQKNYTFFTNFLKSTGSGFLVGDSLTWVDLLIAQNTVGVDREGVLGEFPEMKDHQKRIHKIPSIRKWIETRSVSS